MNFTNKAPQNVGIKTTEYVGENIPYRTRNVDLAPGQSLFGNGFNLRSGTSAIVGVITYADGKKVDFYMGTPHYFGTSWFGLGEDFSGVLQALRPHFIPGETKTLTDQGKDVTVTSDNSVFPTELTRFNTTIR